MGETERKFSVPATVVFQDLGDETVLLDLENGEYFAVDGTGKRIWESLTAGKTLGQIAALLVEEFAVDQGVAFADLRKFVAELTSRRLIAEASEDSQPHSPLGR
jgi:hypothetical protein